MEKPKTGLKYCKQYQQCTCCNSLMDQMIKETMEKISTNICPGKYPDLKLWACFHCSPNAPNYIDFTNKEIRICHEFFKDNIWGNDLDQPMKKYDDCGFQRTNDTTNVTYWVLPSQTWQNADQFLQEGVLPLLDRRFSIKLYNESCFNIAIVIQYYYNLVLIIILIIAIIN